MAEVWDEMVVGEGQIWGLRKLGRVIGRFQSIAHLLKTCYLSSFKISSQKLVILPANELVSNFSRLRQYSFRITSWMLNDYAKNLCSIPLPCKIVCRLGTAVFQKVPFLILF